MIDRETIVVHIKTSDKSDKQFPKKLNLKRWKAEGCQEREKKQNHFDVSLCEQALPRSPKIEKPSNATATLWNWNFPKSKKWN